MRVKEENGKAGLKLNIQKVKIMASSPILYGKQMGKPWKQWQILFSWSPKSLWTVIAAVMSKTLAPWKKSYDKARQRFKNQRHHFADKGPYN